MLRPISGSADVILRILSENVRNVEPEMSRFFFLYYSFKRINLTWILTAKKQQAPLGWILLSEWFFLQTLLIQACYRP